MHSKLSSALAVALLVSGCGADSDLTPSGSGGGAVQGSGGTGGAGQGGDANGSGGMGGGGDGNDACRDAAPLSEETPGRLSATSRLEAQDSDYFSFEAREGEWFQIVGDPSLSTYASALRLFDESGETLLATGYAPIPTPHHLGGADRSRLFYRAEAAGTYCLEVLGRDKWLGDAASNAESDIEVKVTPLHSGYTLWSEDSEPNDTLATAQPVAMVQGNPGRYNFYVAGTFEGAADVDVFSIEVPTPMYLSLYPKPAGSGGVNRVGYGFSASIGKISLHDSQSNLIAVVAPEFTPLDSPHCVHFNCSLNRVRVEPGTYTFSVERAPGPIGSNEAYHLGFQGTGPEVPGLQPVEGMAGFAPVDDGTNDVVAGAEGTFSLSLDTVFGGELPEGDVDHWVIDPTYTPPAGGRLAVECKASTNGASINGLIVTYIDGGGVAPERSESEVSGMGVGVVWTDEGDAYGVASTGAVEISSSGPHYIRVENDASMPDGPASDVHYHCLAYPLF